MRHYYFDIRDGDTLQTDDEGRELSSFEAMQEEATLTLAEMALDAMGKRGADHRMSIQVRDDRGSLLKVRWTFEIERLQHSEENSAT
ncbi:hypothetical protein CQ12_40830 [Bradyrhizobium jicamae]|uniref:DUF6894 domain-containing protein n=1 Tax=Bradyrhizobium jicamae TaxID=280332 RepID=A0A0R3LG02_9BRAD|nr:hypothetical protein [Bradyrhizobium jicamae]KRR06743.1 hypothetical protein CQ12_40830 [Bradyrhizobium jicamae]